MQLSQLNWPQARQHTDKIIVIPLGAHEQHGHHLPLATDALIGSEIARRAEEILGDEAIFAPMLWLGCSPHHLAFSGTISVNAPTYIQMIEDIAESLIAGGFRRLFFLNAHGGNVTPANAALNNVQMRLAKTHPELYLVFASWFTLVDRAAGQIEGLKQAKISHACEWETSQILAIAPDLVKQPRPAARFDLEINGEPSRFWSADYSAPFAVSLARTIDQASPTGAFGWPELATPEKGEALLQAAAAEVVAFAREFAQWPTQLEPQVSTGEI